MTSMKVIVAFFFAHIIGFALTVWTIVEFQNGNTSLTKTALELLIAYNLVVFIAFMITIIVLFALNVRRSSSSSSQILVEEGSISLDLENKN